MRAGRGDRGGSEWCARRVRRGYRGSRQAGDAVRGGWRVGGVDRGGPWEGNGSGRGRRSGGSRQAVDAGRKRRWGQAGRVDGKVVGPGCVSLYHQSAWVRTGKPGDHKGTGVGRPGSGLRVEMWSRIPPDWRRQSTWAHTGKPGGHKGSGEGIGPKAPRRDEVGGQDKGGSGEVATNGGVGGVGWRRQRIGDGDRAGEAELRDAAEAGEASRLASLGEVESRRTSNSSSGICSEPWEKWRPGSGRGYRERRCRRARAGGRSSGGESSDRQTRAERVGLLGRRR